MNTNITDAEIELAFKNTNFGRTDYRKLLATSTFKRLLGALIDGVSVCKTEIKDGEIVQTFLSRDDIYLAPEPKEK